MATSVVYIATSSQGVIKYTPGTSAATYLNTAYTVSAGVSIPSNIVTGVAEYGNGNKLYAATSEGIWEYDYANDSGRTITTSTEVSSGDKLPSNDIKKLNFDSTRLILYAILSTGCWMYKVKRDTGDFVAYSNPVNTRLSSYGPEIYFTTNNGVQVRDYVSLGDYFTNHYWFGTNTGVTVTYNPAESDSWSTSSIPSGKTNDITAHKDSQNSSMAIYFATDAGFIESKPEGGDDGGSLLNIYTTSNSNLPSNTISCLDINTGHLILLE